MTKIRASGAEKFLPRMRLRKDLPLVNDRLQYTLFKQIVVFKRFSCAEPTPTSGINTDKHC